jgi:hypothetical protein
VAECCLSGPVQRDAAALGDVFFVPIVSPDKLSGFEEFMYEYFASDPEIGDSAGIAPASVCMG